MSTVHTSIDQSADVDVVTASKSWRVTDGAAIDIDRASKEAWKETRHFQVRYLAIFTSFRHVQAT